MQEFQERLPLHESRADIPPSRNSWSFTSFTSLTGKVKMDPEKHRLT